MAIFTQFERLEQKWLKMPIFEFPADIWNGPFDHLGMDLE